jgi:hypothetical protein
MAMVVLVLPARTEVSVGPETAARLARFGIGHAALLGDDRAVAVVLEGWAFDPERFAAAAAEVIAPGVACRVLSPLAEVTVAIGSEARPGSRRLPQNGREEP